MSLIPLLGNEFQKSFIFYELAYTLSKQSGREISRIFDQKTKQNKNTYILDCDNQLGTGWGLK